MTYTNWNFWISKHQVIFFIVTGQIAHEWLYDRHKMNWNTWKSIWQDMLDVILLGCVVMPLRGSAAISLLFDGYEIASVAALPRNDSAIPPPAEVAWNAGGGLSLRQAQQPKVQGAR